MAQHSSLEYVRLHSYVYDQLEVVDALLAACPALRVLDFTECDYRVGGVCTYTSRVGSRQAQVNYSRQYDRVCESVFYSKSKQANASKTIRKAQKMKWANMC